ncbi:hypothetical protein [Herbaspirillum huttiense]|uniref:hypothetical protein n=1 Tax=Herbaspirillum huttiense TaxID=863372 RepID=UPI002E794B8D|nr:hypothetical protein [Herbaspirillum huttiense]MEE1638421.1 hypothetical protein [Herbaspirillum huttiense NC40101]
MLNGYPEEEELRRRILNQLSWHASSDVVGVFWLGYLAGLLEWGVIDIDVYGRLKNLLPLVGDKEVHEMFSDEPLSSEDAREIEAYLNTRKS